jgi:hypothetical protein
MYMIVDQANSVHHLFYSNTVRQDNQNDILLWYMADN